MEIHNIHLSSRSMQHLPLLPLHRLGGDVRLGQDQANQAEYGPHFHQAEGLAMHALMGSLVYEKVNTISYPYQLF